MKPAAQQYIDADLLRKRLILRNAAAEKKLLDTHKSAKQFFERLQLRPGKIRQHAKNLLTSGALAGTILLSNPLITIPIQPHPLVNSSNPQLPEQLSGEELTQIINSNLRDILPLTGDWKLTDDQEKEAIKRIKGIYGVPITGTVDGNKLLNNYGRMGAEQHLPRYPGDNVYAHERLVDKGITPGLGGWGYWEYDPSKLTKEEVEEEKWYVAVPIIYLPDWHEKVKYYVDWYKYRRVFVVNPANGKAVVADVADAGPSNWTGKHFGGSPEVMEYLGINYGMQNHPVVMFFLDDPNKEIPLGPLEYNWEKNKEETQDKI